jgi:hypothetical protein
MALTVNHPLLKEQTVQAHSASIGASAATAYTTARFRGKIVKLIGVTGGVITTADATVTCSINGTAITGGSFVITSTSAAAGQVFSATPTGANTVVEDDVISFAPSGGSAASIPGTFQAVIQSA